MGINWNLWGHAIGIYILIGLVMSWVGFMTKHTKNYSRVRQPSWGFEVALIMAWPVLATMEFLRSRQRQE
jgi:tryptophan-rich sensory protein